MDIESQNGLDNVVIEKNLEYYKVVILDQYFEVSILLIFVFKYMIKFCKIFFVKMKLWKRKK